MLLPVVYLEHSLDSKVASDFLGNFCETTQPEGVVHIFYERPATELAKVFGNEIEEISKGVSLHVTSSMGRHKALKEIAFEMTRCKSPWVYLEPGLVEFNEPGWLDRLEKEYRARVIEAAKSDAVLGAQGEDAKGFIAPLIAVYPGNFFETSDLVKYPARAPEAELRWEMRARLRPSDVISLAEGYPVLAKVGV